MVYGVAFGELNTNQTKMLEAVFSWLVTGINEKPCGASIEQFGPSFRLVKMPVPGVKVVVRW